MDTLASRVKQLRQDRGISQEDLADAVGASQASITKIETGRVERSLFIPDIALALNCSESWLRYGDESREISQLKAHPSLLRTIPQGSWESDDFSWMAPLPTMVPEAADAFYLIVENDANAPEIPIGALMVVRPDIKPRNGDIVVVKSSDGSKSARSLMTDGADMWLRPLNQQYPGRALKGEVIVGTVIETRRIWKAS